MEPRVKDVPSFTGAGFDAMLKLEAALGRSSLPRTIRELVKLRASQINGCAYCVDMHAHAAKASGETDERLFAVAAWREAPFFNERERAALALTESATRLSDREDPVGDPVWDAAREQFDDDELGALVMTIAAINAWNRVNVITRQPAGLHRR